MNNSVLHDFTHYRQEKGDFFRMGGKRRILIVGFLDSIQEKVWKGMLEAEKGGQFLMVFWLPSTLKSMAKLASTYRSLEASDGSEKEDAGAGHAGRHGPHG
jgi:hypothetical protein